jgi:hypothetical protein
MCVRAARTSDRVADVLMSRLIRGWERSSSLGGKFGDGHAGSRPWAMRRDGAAVSSGSGCRRWDQKYIGHADGVSRSPPPGAGLAAPGPWRPSWRRPGVGANGRARWWRWSKRRGGPPARGPRAARAVPTGPVLPRRPERRACQVTHLSGVLRTGPCEVPSTWFSSALAPQVRWRWRLVHRECPTGSGRQINLYEVAHEIGERPTGIFPRDDQGRRPGHGGHPGLHHDPHGRGLLFGAAAP